MAFLPHEVHVGFSTFYSGQARSQAEWEEGVGQLLDEGQAFVAYDLARTALERYPASLKLKQSAARALTRVGALEEARKSLEELCPGLQVNQSRLRQLYEQTRKVMALVAGADTSPSPDTLAALAQALAEIGRASAALQQTSAPDEETVGLLGRVYKDLWKRSGAAQMARLSRDTYRYGFEATGGYYTGINAAAMSWLVGDTDLARTLARQVLAACESRLGSEAQPRADYWVQAARGEAYLLLGETAQAREAYGAAARLAGAKYAQGISTYQQLKLLASHAFPVPADLFELFKPPAIVVFTGHMIDRPDRPAPRFPANQEDRVRKEIEAQVQALEARIGYCSPACGSDILFIEAMLARNAEVNLVLPFAVNDFVETSVRHAGPQWVNRFNNVLRLANSVKLVTEEHYLGDDMLFSFAAQIFQGYASLRARALETVPYLLAVWDGQPLNYPGGTADIVSQWPDREQLRIIRLDDHPVSPPPSSLTGAAVSDSKRSIQTMLFADIVGYSKLPERYTPCFLQFLAQVSHALKQRSVQPRFINTWGDAIFAVMDDATTLLDYALALQQAVLGASGTDLGLPENLSIRIALHVGPVYGDTDPFTANRNYYGAHVNRAARLEPVTLPGHIYASEQFVALLAAEQTAAANAARLAGRAYASPFISEYVGVLSLAKNFGAQVVYHLRRRETTE